MTRSIVRWILIAMLGTGSAYTNAQTRGELLPQAHGSLYNHVGSRLQTRGELLYSTHCISCHTTGMHWRVNKKAYDWDSLKFQVRRWQGNTGLMWSEEEVTDVSRYLNDTIYQYPVVNDRVELVSPKKPLIGKLEKDQ